MDVCSSSKAESFDLHNISPRDMNEEIKKEETMHPSVPNDPKKYHYVGSKHFPNRVSKYCTWEKKHADKTFYDGSWAFYVCREYFISCTVQNRYNFKNEITCVSAYTCEKNLLTRLANNLLKCQTLVKECIRFIKISPKS